MKDYQNLLVSDGSAPPLPHCHCWPKSCDRNGVDLKCCIYFGHTHLNYAQHCVWLSQNDHDVTGVPLSTTSGSVLAAYPVALSMDMDGMSVFAYVMCLTRNKRFNNICPHITIFICAVVFQTTTAPNPSLLYVLYVSDKINMSFAKHIHANY